MASISDSKCFIEHGKVKVHSIMDGLKKIKCELKFFVSN